VIPQLIVKVTCVALTRLVSVIATPVKLVIENTVEPVQLADASVIVTGVAALRAMIGGLMA
jgi:hypothetical protein